MFRIFKNKHSIALFCGVAAGMAGYSRVAHSGPYYEQCVQQSACKTVNRCSIYPYYDCRAKPGSPRRIIPGSAPDRYSSWGDHRGCGERYERRDPKKNVCDQWVSDCGGTQSRVDSTCS